MQLVNIELDKTRHIYFGFKAQGITEKLLGIRSFLRYDFENISINDMGIILYAGLAWEDNDLTLESTIELVDKYSDTLSVVAAISEAISIAMPESKANEIEKNAKRAAKNPKN